MHRWLARALAPFAVLRECALRELALVYLMAFVSMLGYFIFSYVLVLHLVEELGLDDEATGVLYGAFGIAIAVWSIVLGVVVDRVGVRIALAVGNGVGALGTLAFAFVRAEQRLAMGVLLFAVLPFSLGLASPAVPIAIRRFSTARAQQLAFSIYYTVMNVAAVLAAPLVDVARTTLPATPYAPPAPPPPPCVDGVCAVPPAVDAGGLAYGGGAPAAAAASTLVLPLPRYALLIAVSALTSALAALFSFALRDGAAVDAPPSKAGARRGMLAEMRATMRDRNFWRFVVLSGALIGVKSTFRYLDALYPVYVERAFSPDETRGVPYMSLLAVNPAIVIALTVVVERLVTRLRTHPINVIIAGAAVSGLSPLIMMASAAGPPLAVRWGAIVAFIAVFSLGEILWSPTLYTYTCALAPRGGEGAFFALANVPLFAAKLITGSLSGVLLARYCPAAGLPGVPCDGALMWGVIGATTASSAVLLAAVRGYVRVATSELEAGRAANAGEAPRDEAAHGGGGGAPGAYVELEEAGAEPWGSSAVAGAG